MIGDYANQSDKSYKAVTAHLSSSDKSWCWRHVEVLAHVAIYLHIPNVSIHTVICDVCTEVITGLIFKITDNYTNVYHHKMFLMKNIIISFMM